MPSSGVKITRIIDDLDKPNGIPNTWVAAVGTYICASAVCDRAWTVEGMAPRRAYTAGYDGYYAVELLGEPVRLVEWPKPNPKITTAEDLPMAAAVLRIQG